VSHEAGLIDVFDLGVPGRPERVAQHRIPLKPGDVVTCVSVHPECDCALAAVRAAGSLERGQVLFLDLSTGAILHRVPVGVGPDDLAVRPDGRFAVVANEAEQVVWDPVTRSYASAPGSVSVIDLCRGPGCATVQHVLLPDLTGRRGLVQPEHARFLRCDVDLDGDGLITDPRRTC